MDDAHLVEVLNGLGHLLHNAAGILLREVALNALVNTVIKH